MYGVRHVPTERLVSRYVQRLRKETKGPLYLSFISRNGVKLRIKPRKKPFGGGNDVLVFVCRPGLLYSSSFFQRSSRSRNTIIRSARTWI
jgi:hypothetical protein